MAREALGVERDKKRARKHSSQEITKIAVATLATTIATTIVTAKSILADYQDKGSIAVATLATAKGTLTDYQDNGSIAEADFLTLMLNEEKDCGMNSEDEVTTPIKNVTPATTDREQNAIKSLSFDVDCVGSSSGKMSRDCSMTKKKYMRKFKVMDEDEDEGEEDEAEIEDAREVADDEDASGAENEDASG
ncbi:hypothetical protein CASFOL_011487 [Castilleja foliolosa]|uniref:Uncharacterized protein n=1 Tax=Castilleja foliolosa TaxID=1961234 RepID=A0ABD3DXJ4_9LAMI